MPRWKGKDRPDVPPPTFPSVVAVRAFVDQTVDEGDEVQRRLAAAALDAAALWEAAASRELQALAADILGRLAGEPSPLDMLRVRHRARELGFHEPEAMLPSLYCDFARLGAEARRRGRR
jgi:hypothetical protein